MVASLSWLNDLAQWLGRWVPRPVLIEPTHRGVRFGPKGGAVAVGPGLVVFWPIMQQLVVLPIVTRSVEFNSRLVPLGGEQGRALLPRVGICAVAVQYRVVDVIKTATSVLNLHPLLDNRIQAAVGKFWRQTKDPLADVGGWRDFVLQEMRGVGETYGVEIEAVDVTQLGVGVAVKNMSDWNYSDDPAGARPAA